MDKMKSNIHDSCQLHFPSKLWSTAYMMFIFISQWQVRNTGLQTVEIIMLSTKTYTKNIKIKTYMVASRCIFPSIYGPLADCRSPLSSLDTSDLLEARDDGVLMLILLPLPKLIPRAAKSVPSGNMLPCLCVCWSTYIFNECLTLHFINQ